MIPGCARRNLDWIQGQKKKITERVVKHWGRLPREVVVPPTLEVFKIYVDMGLSNMVYWWTW